MQKAVQLMVGFLLFGSAVFPARAAFTNLYIFGDALSTTTNNTSGLPFYYGKRYSNGRVWVEVLAQRQGISYDPNKNWSYYANSCTTMLANVTSFSIAPSAASNALFVIWVNCADLWFPAYYSVTSVKSWTNAINQSQTNHYKAATNLYAKGVRTLIMPNAVDLSTIPEFNNSGNTTIIHQMCTNYNAAFTNTLNQIRASCPNLTLYTPDFFTLLTNLIAHPANYGVTNALCDGVSIDAVDAAECDSYTYPTEATNGFGTNFIFWDNQDPTAMVHDWMANLTQQLISPASISQITMLTGSNRLDLANVPVGQTGLVLCCTSLANPNWKTNGAFFLGTNVSQSVYVTNSADPWFYRLSYLYSWKWP